MRDQNPQHAISLWPAIPPARRSCGDPLDRFAGVGAIWELRNRVLLDRVLSSVLTHRKRFYSRLVYS